MMAADDKGNGIDVGHYSIYRYVSEKRDAIQFEIYGGNNIIRFSIEESDSYYSSKGWVKSEDSFDYPNES